MGKLLYALGAALTALSSGLDEKKHQEDDHAYYQAQRRIFYQVVQEKEISSRFLITTTLITLSSACLAVIPAFFNIAARLNGEVAYPVWIQVAVWAAFVSLGVNILFGLWMYCLDSKQLGYLKALNDGECAGKDYSSFTALLQIVQYFLFALSVIAVVILAIWRVLYA